MGEILKFRPRPAEPKSALIKQSTLAEIEKKQRVLFAPSADELFDDNVVTLGGTSISQHRIRLLQKLFTPQGMERMWAFEESLLTLRMKYILKSLPQPDDNKVSLLKLATHTYGIAASIGHRNLQEFCVNTAIALIEESDGELIGLIQDYRLRGTILARSGLKG